MNGFESIGDAWLQIAVRITIAVSAGSLLVAAMVRLFPRMPAEIRHALWAIVMLQGLCWFSIPVTVTGRGTGHDSRSAISASPHPPVGPVGEEEAITVDAAPNEPHESIASAPDVHAWDSSDDPPQEQMGDVAVLQQTSEFSKALLASIVWLAGVIVLAGIGAARYWRFRRRIASSARPASEALQRAAERIAAQHGLRRPLRLVESEHCAVPLVFGALRPTIVVPSQASGLAPQQIEPLLAHEIAHVRRGDPLVAALGLVSCLLNFFNPFAWWAARRLAVAREECADRWVTQTAGFAPVEYARSLLQIAESLAQFRTAGVSAVGRSSELRARIAMILSAHSPESRAARRCGQFLAVALAAGAILSLLSVRTAPADKSAEAAQNTEASGQAIDKRPQPGRPTGDQEVSALDSLHRSQIPPYELSVAGRGAPENAPQELVAILGDSRLKHHRKITDVAFSPDGRIIATAGGGTVQFWNRETGRAERVLETATHFDDKLAFSSDGSTLATGGINSPVELWDVDTGMRRHALTHWGSALAFSPDGSVLAFGDVGNRELMIADAKSGEVVRRVDYLAALDEWRPGSRGSVSRLCFTPDSQNLAVAVSGGKENPGVRIVFCDAATLKPQRLLSGQGGMIRGLVISSNGRQLISCSDDGTAHAWDVESGDVQWTCRADQEYRWAAEARYTDRDATVLVLIGSEIRVLDATTGKERRRIPLRHSSICFDLSPDGRAILAGGLRAQLLSVETAESILPGAFAGPQAGFHDVAFDTAGNRIAAAGQDGVTTIWDVRSRSIVHRLEAGSSIVESVVYSPDGQYLATGELGGQIRLWDAATARLLKTFGNNASRDLTFSPDSSLLAGAGRQVVRVWSIPHGNEVRHFLSQSSPSVSFSGDGQKIASGPSVWEITGTRLHQVAVNRYGPSDLSQDGAMLVEGRAPPRLWDLATGKERAVLEGHGRGTDAIVYSPDGKQIATAGGDGTVRLWNARDGAIQKILEVAPEGARVNGVAFSPDSRYLATANGNGTVYILSVSPPKIAAPADGAANARGDGRVDASQGSLPPPERAEAPPVVALEGDEAKRVRAHLQQVAQSTDEKLRSGSGVGVFRRYVQPAGEDEPELRTEARVQIHFAGDKYHFQFDIDRNLIRTTYRDAEGNETIRLANWTYDDVVLIDDGDAVYLVKFSQRIRPTGCSGEIFSKRDVGLASAIGVSWGNPAQYWKWNGSMNLGAKLRNLRPDEIELKRTSTGDYLGISRIRNSPANVVTFRTSPEAGDRLVQRVTFHSELNRQLSSYRLAWKQVENVWYVNAYEESASSFRGDGDTEQIREEFEFEAFSPNVEVATELFDVDALPIPPNTRFLDRRPGEQVDKRFPLPQKSKDEPAES